MEEDIFIVESFLKNKKMLLKHPVWVSEQTLQAIENLINKYKEQKRDIRDTHILLAKYSPKNEEQEKIIELMANFINNIADIDEDICKVMGQRPYCTEYNEEGKCVECVKSYFKEKARENNEI